MTDVPPKKSRSWTERLIFLGMVAVASTSVYLLYDSSTKKAEAARVEMTARKQASEGDISCAVDELVTFYHNYSQTSGQGTLYIVLDPKELAASQADPNYKLNNGYYGLRTQALGNDQSFVFRYVPPWDAQKRNPFNVIDRDGDGINKYDARDNLLEMKDGLGTINDTYLRHLWDAANILRARHGQEFSQPHYSLIRSYDALEKPN
ncbi:MAG: hypothetical protein WCV90_01050 [Candidatus Woesearchaeota archaeon]